MFTVKAFTSPDKRDYKANPAAGYDHDHRLDREVSEASYYQIAKIADDHVAVYFTNPAHPSRMDQVNVGRGQVFWRVIIENSNGTNVEKIQVSPDSETGWVQY